jgi:glucose-1-phosphatase
MANFKNILFDLGGIFLDIDYNRTEQSFIELGITDFGKRFSQQFSNNLFEDLETGQITPEVFYDRFRQETGTELANEAIEKAWNAMLLTFPKERLDWLKAVGEKYPVYLYSNTNLIHYQSFTSIFETSFPGEKFNDHFITAYYSHEVGLRKPYPESYLKIMELEKLNPAETLFIDDTLKNIDGARAAGLQTLLLNGGKTVLDLEIG